MFEVTLVDKSLHPQADRIPEGGKAWAINGQAGPRLNLVVGNSYHFNVKQDIIPGSEPQEFYFTRDIIGGAAGLGLADGPQLEGTNSTTNGILTLRIDDQTPRTFYYQSKNSAFIGGLIVVHDSNKSDDKRKPH